VYNVDGEGDSPEKTMMQSEKSSVVTTGDGTDTADKKAGVW